MSYATSSQGIVTWSKIKAFRFCKNYYKTKYLDLALESDEPQVASKALRIGSLFDKASQDPSILDEIEIVKRMPKDGQALQSEIDTVQGLLHEVNRSTLYKKGEKEQVKLQAKYKDLIIGGTPDRIDYKNKIIIDDKTSAGTRVLVGRGDDGDRFIENYVYQLSMYQYLLELNGEDRHFSGYLNILLKPETLQKPPKHLYLEITAQELLEARPQLITWLDEINEAQKYGIYPTEHRSKCLKCEAYGVCPFAVQKEPITVDELINFY